MRRLRNLFAALARAAGIPTLVVGGIGNGGAHAWNEVKIGGTWYALNATLDDPVVVFPVDNQTR